MSRVSYKKNLVLARRNLRKFRRYCRPQSWGWWFHVRVEQRKFG